MMIDIIIKLGYVFGLSITSWFIGITFSKILIESNIIKEEVK